MSPEPLKRDADVLRHAVDVLRERLPSGWEARAFSEVPLGADPRGPRADAVIELTAPDRSRITVEAAMTAGASPETRGSPARSSTPPGFPST